MYLDSRDLRHPATCVKSSSDKLIIELMDKRRAVDAICVQSNAVYLDVMNILLRL